MLADDRWYPVSRKPLVIVGGVIANKYRNGGAVWTRLNWVLGFRQLGYDVVFIEQIERNNCFDAQGRVTTFKLSSNLEYFKKVMQEFDLSESAALVYEDGQECHGMSLREIRDLANDANLVINITGHLRLSEIMDSPACKVYIDLDPGYTQLWHQAGLLDAHFLAHDKYFTIGEAIGTSECSIPVGDIPWQTTRQPVVLDLWPVSTKGDPERFTTIASWRDDYGTLQQGGRRLGVKAHEFRRFIGFPGLVSQNCEIALNLYSGDRADLDQLNEHEWLVKDPKLVVPDPITFRKYVQESGAEFSVAKEIYRVTNGGWFSDRTVRYLASGKPALVQDTGFSKTYPVGDGLLAFDSMSSAVAGAGEISRNYAAHCQAARQMAETFFDSDKVLGNLAERIGITP